MAAQLHLLMAPPLADHLIQNSGVAAVPLPSLCQESSTEAVGVPASLPLSHNKPRSFR